MELKKITREEEYNAALERFEEIMFAKEGSEEDNEAYLLGLIIEDYEAENFPIDEPDPISYIDSRLDALGLKRKDLVNVIAASESHVSDVMNKRRALSLDAIRKLRDEFNMDNHVLMQRYELKDSTVKKRPKKSDADVRVPVKRKAIRGGKPVRLRKSKSIKAKSVEREKHNKK